MKTIKKDKCSYSVSNAIRTLAMVRQKGFEPPTFWFVAVRYSRITRKWCNKATVMN